MTLAVLGAMVVLAGCTGGMSGESNGEPAAGGDAAQAPGSYYEDGEAVIVRSATMTIEVEEFDRQFRLAREVAGTHGGFVTDYTIERERGWQKATFVVKVPASNFSESRDDLADLGTVESEVVEAEDFTAEYHQRKGRLETLRERQQELERQLEEAETADERSEVRSELADVRGEIRELEGEQQALEHRESLSTIEVTMREPEGEKPPENYETAYGFDDAFLQGLYGGLAILKGIVVLVGYLLALGLGMLVVGVVGMCLLAGGLAVKVHVWPRIRNLFRIPESASIGSADRPHGTGPPDPPARDEPPSPQDEDEAP